MRIIANSPCDVCGCQTDTEYLTNTIAGELCPECWQEWRDYLAMSA